MEVYPAKPAADVLYRSEIEIARILQALCREQTMAYTLLYSSGAEQLFISRILSVEPGEGTFHADYSIEKPFNNRVLQSRALKFKASYRNARVAFIGRRPAGSSVDGMPAIRFELPRTLLHYQREYSRLHIPAHAPLHCLVAAGEGSPEQMHVVDVSQDGMGCVVQLGAGGIQKGMVLKDCLVPLPGDRSLKVDLIVRYTRRITLKNGTVATRIGVRFMQRPDEIAELVGRFVQVVSGNPY